MLYTKDFILLISRGGKVEDNYGHLEIRLDELLKKKGLSKNKLSYKAEISWKQIDNYCTNNITRLNIYIFRVSTGNTKVFFLFFPYLK